MSRFSFRCDSLPESSHVVSFRGNEGISKLFRFEVALLVPDSDCATLVLDDVVGARASLTVQPQDDSPAADQHRVHGVVSEIELVHSENGKTLLSVSLVSAFHRLTESMHSRMFTGETVPDIIGWIVDDAGLGAQLDLRLSGDHPEEDHLCQYRESDFDFIARWMEREGIYFFFDHSGDDEMLVVADHKSAHDPCRDVGVRFRPLARADTSAGESLSEFRPVQRALPASVRIQDYDPTRPSLDVSAVADVSSEGQGQVVIHEARCFSPADAERLAAIRAEELIAGGRTFETAGTVFGLRSGYVISLEEHTESDLNQDYVITELWHEGCQSLEAEPLREMLGHNMPEGYSLRAKVLPADLQYRHPSRTPWPRIRGFELGVIDGEADSDYAQLDEHGRYFVRFHFDERELADGRASTRIRMMQPHAGAPEGFHFPLRKDTEVVVAFLGGDPDRPVIAGAVPNAHHPAVVTSDNHTQNVIQTGGGTRIELEDAEGSQHVYVYTPTEETYLHLGEPFNPKRNIVLKTNKDCLVKVGTNQDVEIGGVLEEKVTKDVSETYKNTQTSTIDGKQQTTTTGAVLEQYFSKHKTTVKGGERKEDFDGGQQTLLAGSRTETYHGGMTAQVFGGSNEFWIGDYTRRVTGNTMEHHNGAMVEMAAGSVTEIAPNVEEQYGDTTGVWASLTWLSPLMDIKAPNWTITTPLRIEIKVLDTNIKPILTGNDRVSMGTTILKGELLGKSRGALAIKTEATGVNIGLCGPKIEVGGVRLEAGILNVDVAGLFKK